jgi:hypothetical protein
MVNPYAQNRPQPKPKTQINIGQSQALKKFDDFQNKQSSKSASKDKISTFFGSDEEDSIIRRSSQKFIKTSNEYKGTKVVVKLKSEDDSEFDSDDEDDDDDDDDDDETTLTQNKMEAKDTALSTSRQLGSASSLSKRNKVKFETDVAKRRQQASGSATGDTDDNVTISDELFNKNLILDIQDLDIDDDTKAKTKKATKKTDKVSKKPSRSQKDNRKLSKSTISENIDYSSITDNDSVSKVQSVTDITDGANESFDTDSSVQNHLILDINELALAYDADNHVSSKSKSKNATRKKVTVPTGLARKSNGRSKQTKEPTSIQTVPDGYESSINTEIKDDYEEIFTEKSHQAHEYNDDFISETEPQSTSRRTTKSSLKQYNNKRVSISPKLYVKQATRKTKTIETQVGDNDFIDKHDLISSLNFYTPSSYLSTKKAYLTNLNRMIEFNTVNHAVDEMIRMNIQFLKNFLATQRIMYESELESMKPELVDP